MEKNIRIFGIPKAGKSVYLSVLFDQINKHGFGNYTLDMKDNDASMDYLLMILEDLEIKGDTDATPIRHFNELNLNLCYQEGRKVKTAARISTYDISGEITQLIFDPRFHAQIKKSIIPPEFRDDQKRILDLLYSGDCFILIADPESIISTFDEQDTMFMIILDTIKKNKSQRKKSRDRSNNGIKDIKIAFCISKTDLIEVKNAKEFVQQKMPFTFTYLDINFENNFICLPISSLGYNYNLKEFNLNDLKPINIIEPLRFFLEK